MDKGCEICFCLLKHGGQCIGDPYINTCDLHISLKNEKNSIGLAKRKRYEEDENF
jgi:hypothetical protein